MNCNQYKLPIVYLPETME